MQNRILAHTANANIYGRLWTPMRICAGWTYFLIFLYVFLSYFHPNDITTSKHHQHYMTDYYHHHSIMYDNNPLNSPVYSALPPVICKDFSP